MNVPHAVQPSLAIPPELYEPTFGSSYTCNIWSEWRVTGQIPTHQATHAYANDTYYARKSEAGVAMSACVAMSASSADDTSQGSEQVGVEGGHRHVGLFCR